MSKGTFGDCLKREREMREVSLEEICAATRIGTRFLEAMENEEWEKLPGGVFNRGFVRAVARFLGLDEETMLSEYDLARSNHGGPIYTAPAQPIPRAFPKWIPIAVVLLLGGLIAASLQAWRIFGSRRATARNAASSRASTLSTTPAPALPTTSTSPAPPETRSTAIGVPGQTISSDPASKVARPSESPATAALQLSIAAAKSTQLQVLADGKTLYDAIINAGEHQHFQAREEFDVSVSDAGGVLLELNGQTMPPLATPGSPGKISLTRKDLKKADSGTD